MKNLMNPMNQKEAQMNNFNFVHDGIFKTVQGEGSLVGIPMVFVRLAGCSVGCNNCDTNYSVSQIVDADEILRSVASKMANVNWIWITGGEPSDQDLRILVSKLQLVGKVAVATAGIRELPIRPDFVSVSPHGLPSKLVQTCGDQINLVPGLNDMDISQWMRFDFSGFKSKWVTPLFGDSNSLQNCLDFIEFNPDFRLGFQAHKQWKMR